MEGKGKRSREDEDSETLRFESRSEEVEGECRFLWGKNIPGPKVGAFGGPCVGMDLTRPGRAPCPVLGRLVTSVCWWSEHRLLGLKQANCLPPGQLHAGFVILSKLLC